VSQIVSVARGEWTFLLRSRLAAGGCVALALLVVVAAVSSAARMAAEHDRRHHHQSEADAAFVSQPDRHPHRMVHYGHYVFRTPSALAAVDPGVDPVAGTAMFLEGHRRNTAAFAEARETSVLTRFGVLSPAFAAQALAPLLLILVGFSGVARERESGALLLLRAQGLGAGTLLVGKVLALGAVALLAWVPLAVATLLISWRAGEALYPAVVLVLGHAIYLGFWVLSIVAISALVARSRDALLMLSAFWVLGVLLVPRIAADVAAARVPVLPLALADISMHQALRRMGDSHNAADPGFRGLLQTELARYGVARVEDLPVNFRGLVSLQGEAAASALMDRFAAERQAQHHQQSAFVQRFVVISPLLAIRQASMAAAGTDLTGHQRFLEGAEAYRLTFVQHLNRLHVELLSYTDDVARSRDAEAERRTRISAANWAEIPRFVHVPEDPALRARSALSGVYALAGWCAGALLLLGIAGRRIDIR